METFIKYASSVSSLNPCIEGLLLVLWFPTPTLENILPCVRIPGHESWCDGEGRWGSLVLLGGTSTFCRSEQRMGAVASRPQARGGNGHMHHDYPALFHSLECSWPLQRCFLHISILGSSLVFSMSSFRLKWRGGRCHTSYFLVFLDVLLPFRSHLKSLDSLLEVQVVLWVFLLGMCSGNNDKEGSVYMFSTDALFKNYFWSALGESAGAEPMRKGSWLYL